jgi:hypothetical protein
MNIRTELLKAPKVKDSYYYLIATEGEPSNCVWREGVSKKE